MRLATNIAPMICAMVVAMWRVAALLLRVLSVPPGAATIYNPSEGATILSRSSLIIVPMDRITLQTAVNAVAAELVGIIISLCMLYQITQS